MHAHSVMVMAQQEYPPPFKMVVALDASEYAEIVLEHAMDQAARHPMPELHFLVVAERSRTSAAEIERLRNWLTSTVVEGLASFQREQHWKTRVHIRDGKPVEEIVNLAAELQASLLVIGRYGNHRWRKSLTDRVVDEAPCPTLVVGLTEHAVEAHPQCPACVEVRAATDGERWFCDEHSADDRLRWSTLVSDSKSMMGGAML